MVRKPFQDTFREITSVIIVLENRKGLLILAFICFNEFPIFSALSAYQRFFNAQQVNYWKVSLIIDAFVKHCSHHIVLTYLLLLSLVSLVHFSPKKD